MTPLQLQQIYSEGLGISPANARRSLWNAGYYAGSGGASLTPQTPNPVQLESIYRSYLQVSEQAAQQALFLNGFDTGQGITPPTPPASFPPGELSSITPNPPFPTSKLVPQGFNMVSQDCPGAAAYFYPSQPALPSY